MEKEPTIYDALAKAQAKFGQVVAGKTGRDGNREYKYAPLPALLEAIRKPLNDEGLFLTQSTGIDEQGHCYVSTCVAMGDTKLELDREFYEYSATPKDFGARETYARRYGLNKAFCLAGEDDNDGTVAPQQQPRQKKAQPDKRKRMLARIAELKVRCIELGCKEQGLIDYERATFGDVPVDKLSDANLEMLGKHLATLAKDKEQLNEHQ